MNESPSKTRVYDNNVTSTLNIVNEPVENYLEPPDEEEYEEEQDDQEANDIELAIKQSLEEQKQAQESFENPDDFVEPQH